MKSLLKISSLLLLIPLLFVACKKENNDETPTGPLGAKYPQVINNVITPEILESLKKNGMTINSGTTPPTINGVFLFSPAYCSFDDSGNNLKGSYFNDYKIQFKNQNTNDYTVSMEYKDVSDGTDSGGDNNATYISGENNLFTVFSQVKGKSGNVNYVALDVISGEAAAGSMKNLIWSHYLVSKEGDVSDVFLVPVGTTRIFKDENGLSNGQTTFSMLPKNLQSIVKKSLSLSTAR